MYRISADHTFAGYRLGFSDINTLPLFFSLSIQFYFIFTYYCVINKMIVKSKNADIPADADHADIPYSHHFIEDSF